MTVKEIKKAIKNKDILWGIDGLFVIELHSENVIVHTSFVEYYENGTHYYEFDFEKVFKTKEEAMHYLFHANIRRIEEFPFITWKEFVDGKKVNFKAKDGHNFLLSQVGQSICLLGLDTNNVWKTWELNEENFYKSYDKCVELFVGEKNE